MKIRFLFLCAGVLLMAAPGRAQSPPAAPVLLVYVSDESDLISPRIALGTEQPVLKITAFEKCAKIPSVINLQEGGLALKLNPDDARVLAAVVRQRMASGNNPVTTIWFASPDNKVLGEITTRYKAANLLLGILSFEDGAQHSLVNYLTDKLHPD